MRSNKIRHLICDQPGSVLKTVATSLDLGEDFIRELFNLGALYKNKIRLTGSEMDTALVGPGDYLRVHTEPRRYTRPADLAERILTRDDRWLVIDKPPGVPCHPTLDNSVENLLTWLSEILGQPVHITHRLDVPTSGCLLLALSSEAAGQFNKLLLKDRVQKEYEALVEGDFTRTGLFTHWMKDDNWAPREVRPEVFENSLECRLEVLKAENFGSFSRLRLRLHTGRTHQIRAQMAALGHPVWNDIMYGAQSRRPGEVIGLRAASLSYFDHAASQTATIESRPRWGQLFAEFQGLS